MFENKSTLSHHYVEHQLFNGFRNHYSHRFWFRGCVTLKETVSIAEYPLCVMLKETAPIAEFPRCVTLKETVSIAEYPRCVMLKETASITEYTILGLPC